MIIFISNLSGCRGNQFTCNDGECIPADHECDNKNDCGDRSDESGCGKNLHD